MISIESIFGNRIGGTIHELTGMIHEDQQEVCNAQDQTFKRSRICPSLPQAVSYLSRDPARVQILDDLSTGVHRWRSRGKLQIHRVTCRGPRDPSLADILNVPDPAFREENRIACRPRDCGDRQSSRRCGHGCDVSRLLATPVSLSRGSMSTPSPGRVPSRSPSEI